jgi:hypothetical protein
VLFLTLWSIHVHVHCNYHNPIPPPPFTLFININFQMSILIDDILMWVQFWYISFITIYFYLGYNYYKCWRIMMLPRGKIPIVYGHCDDVFGEISTLYSSYNILTVIFLLVYLPTSRNVFIIMFICCKPNFMCLHNFSEN